MSSKYISYSDYLFKKYGKKSYRVGIDAGFSCPNRLAGRSSFGCSFCEGAGSKAAYVRNEDGSYPESDKFCAFNKDGFPEAFSREFISSQIDRAIKFLKRRYKAEVFLLYIQAYSGTNASVEVLKEVYDYSLSCANFSELIVSTRPDCIDEDKAKLLASYKRDDFDVWCELGLQTIHDRTLEFINRGHSYSDFLRAFDILKKYEIKVVVHLIFGLPNESEEDMLATIREINRIKPEAIKIHNLHIPKDTPMYKQYLKGEVKAFEYEEHLKMCIKAVNLLDDDIMILRFTCDVTKNSRGVPENIWSKGEFLSKLNRELIKI